MDILIDFTMTLTTHSIRVRKYDNGRIRCFKFKTPRGKVYSQRKIRCDIACFDNDFDAIEYILEPMSIIMINTLDN